MLNSLLHLNAAMVYLANPNLANDDFDKDAALTALDEIDESITMALEYFETDDDAINVSNKSVFVSLAWSLKLFDLAVSLSALRELTRYAIKGLESDCSHDDVLVASANNGGASC